MASNIERVGELLSQHYGDPLLGNQLDPLDEAVYMLLSEKTDLLKQQAAYDALRVRFASWQAALSAGIVDIEAVVALAGMGARRAELLQRLLTTIVERFGELSLSSLASIPTNEAEAVLCALPGIGPKAARCILLYCFGREVLPVDIHTYRLAVRMGILPRTVSYQQAHEALPPLIPDSLRRGFHVNAVAHGRTRCFAHNPRCHDCSLAGYCSWPRAAVPAPIVVRPKPSAVDLFAGAGGLSLGFQMAGFQIVQAVERDERAAATYRANHKGVDVIECDVGKMDPHECLERRALRPGDLTALIGGPPCQGFSESNRRTRTLENPQNHLYRHFLRYVEVMRPAWFVMENVAGLLTLQKGKVLEWIKEEAGRLGYAVAARVLNAADVGVPQVRRRVFIIGNRIGLPPDFPQADRLGTESARVTVADAIADLPILENGARRDHLPLTAYSRPTSSYQKWARLGQEGGSLQGNLVTRNNETVIERYNYVAPGENWESIPDRLMGNYSDRSRCHTGIYHRLEWDKPSRVIGNFRKNMLIHPEQPRGLSVREAARLQSFPDNYVFVDSIGFQQQQVADAVPPLLAKAVAEALLRTMRRGR